MSDVEIERIYGASIDFFTDGAANLTQYEWRLYIQ